MQVHVTIDWAGSIKMDDVAARPDEGSRRARRSAIARCTGTTSARINNRTHRKLLVVDGRVGFTGGVGIADQWEGHAQDPDHWRDMHFRVEGPVVAQMQAAFNDNWIKTTGEVLNGADYFPPLESADGMDAHMFISSPAGGSESMHLMYLMAIAAAEHTIDLEAAYFVPDELITNALLAARKRGVRVRVIVPGEHTDSDAVRHASRMRLGPAARRPAFRDQRVPADDDPQQAADRGQGDGVGGLDQLRPASVPPQRRGQPQRLRRRLRRAHDAGVRGRPQAVEALHLRDVGEPAAEGEVHRDA